mgnify:FL=1
MDRIANQAQGGAVISYRGGTLGSRELVRIQRIVDRQPGARRQDLARAVCHSFGWTRPDGGLAVDSCRLLLLRLDRRGLLRLPPALRRPKRPSSSSELDWLGQLALEPPAVLGLEQPQGPLLVRPIFEQERVGWCAYMQRYHYLGCGQLVGESLRYVALVGEQPVALLGWAAAALHNAPRDRYLGWDAAARARRLPMVVNNTRFLILPWARIEHLASRVLAANVRRLSRDWQQRFGHPVLLAETFVDAARFRGTCYRAANWVHLGQTQGYARRGPSYQHHGAPKLVFVYPLHKRALERLRQPGQPMDAGSKEQTPMLKLDVTKLPLDGKGGLIEVLRGLPDPRQRRGKRYPMFFVMAAAVCAVLSGAQSIVAIAQWVKDQSKPTLRRLGNRRENPPSYSAIRGVLIGVDVAAFDERVGLWLQQHQGRLQEMGLALDGKTSRGSADGDGKPVHLVSAVLHRDGSVLAQHRVPDKTNEIKSVEPLLAGRDIRGAVVTGDAMFTQTEIASHIVQDKQADYVLVVKDNQPTLRQDIEDLHLEVSPP